MTPDSGACLKEDGFADLWPDYDTVALFLVHDGAPRYQISQLNTMITWKIIMSFKFLCKERIIFGLACVVLVCAAGTSTGFAQEPIVWSAPVLLSDPEQHAGPPAVVADKAGNVHLMWSQSASEGNRGANAMYYRRWDGHDWTTAVDVLADTDNAVDFPDLAVTSDGILHAVWTTGRGGDVMYAQAPACCADDPRHWSKPVSLGGPVMLTAALVADKQGRLHVVFADADSSRIVYRRSNDGGITWPVWSEIPGGANLNDEYSIYPRVAVHEHDRVYAVWIIEPWPGRYALFARSDDAGNTWTSPQVIDRYDSSQYELEGYGPEFIDVEAHADQVHLIWDGSPTVERTHIWLTDGGETWSKPAKLFPEITKVGRSGWNDMAFDSAGTLHAVALGEPLHASWSAGNWSRSMPIGQGRDSRGAEWMRLAVGLGNQLHVAWVDKGVEPFRAWYQLGQTQAPAESPRPLPTSASVADPGASAASATPAQLVSIATPAEATAFPTSSRLVDEGGPMKTDSPIITLGLSLVPAALLVTITVIAKLRKRRANGG
ncbi:MAG: sialidase family protein [Anaerolineae bacterium]